MEIEDFHIHTQEKESSTILKDNLDTKKLSIPHHLNFRESAFPLSIRKESKCMKFSEVKDFNFNQDQASLNLKKSINNPLNFNLNSNNPLSSELESKAVDKNDENKSPNDNKTQERRAK